VPFIDFAHPLLAPRPCNGSPENQLSLKELTASAAAVASDIKETGLYVYLLDERRNRHLMLFNNGALLFSNSDKQKFVNPNSNEFLSTNNRLGHSDQSF